MKKTIELNVPNELWVNDFSEAKKASFVYEGPEVIWLTAQDGMLLPSFSTEEPLDLPLSRQAKKVEISKATKEEVAAAILAVNKPEKHEYKYVDEINHDGSIYKKITNPLLSDFFMARLLGTVVSLELIVKDPVYFNVSEAEKRKNYVKRYEETYSFDAETVSKINSFLTEMDAYLNTVKTAYPWKFITVNKGEIPKVPVELVKLFNELPNFSV